jgi:hypothetical protein
MVSNQNNLQVLINERNEYEDYLYDNLNINQNVNEVNEIEEIYHLNRIIFNLIEPLDFWDPVIVNLSIQQINNLEYIYNTVPVECIICNELKNDFKKVGCCNNNICLECTDKWFNLSVYCPFCKCDQRELI